MGKAKYERNDLVTGREDATILKSAAISKPSESILLKKGQG
jgi:hypothetical protein